jgi:hypothetical protein
MKIRTGFVSNSSSSSFVVIMKNGEKMSKDTLLKILEVNEKSPLYGFSLTLTNWMLNNLEENDIKKLHDNYVGGYQKIELTEDEMIRQIIEDYGGIDKDDLEKIRTKQYRYYCGEASNDSGDAIESYLYEADINIETDIIKIKGGNVY